MNNKIKNINFQKGAVSILFSVLLLSLLMIISTSVFILMFQQMKMSGQTGHSVVAFYAAESGAEKCLYEIRNDTGSGCDIPGGGTITNTFTNQANYQTTFNGSNEIISVGKYLETTRRLKLSW